MTFFHGPVAETGDTLESPDKFSAVKRNGFSRFMELGETHPGISIVI